MNDSPDATLTIVIDPDDDADVTAAALAAHDPTAGRVTVHPTPGSDGAGALAEDLLAALGRTPDGPREWMGPCQAWTAVGVWLRTDRISQLIVLRAHLLPSAALSRLAGLAQNPGIRVVLVWHAAPPASWAERLGADAPVAFSDLPSVLVAGPRPPTATAVAAEAVESAEFPDVAVPEADFPHFRGQAVYCLPEPQATAVDAAYRAGMATACRWLCAHPRYRRHPADWPHSASIMPRYQSDADIETSVRFLADRYDAAAASRLVEGMLCLGRDRLHRDPHRPGPPYPMAWSDRAGLSVFLARLVCDATSPAHAITLIRGAQAGMFLHGLFLSVPSDLHRRSGPGLTTVRLDEGAIAHIRRRVTHPQTAAAVATALFTGRDAASLKTIRAFSDDRTSAAEPQDTVTVGDPRTGRNRAVYAIPVPARPLLAAAREYLRQRSGSSKARNPALFSGTGLSDQRLAELAEAAGLRLPAETSQSPWHLGASCWWIGDPLHGPDIRPEPFTQEAFL